MGDPAWLVAGTNAAALMRNVVKDGLDTSLRRSPAQPFFQWRASSRLTVLAYHAIDDPERFKEHLIYLKQHTSPVSLDEVIGALNGGGRLPRRAVLISFDDGDRSLLESGLPLLKDFGLPGVAFVVAGMLGRRGLLWWQEVEALVRADGDGQALAPLLRRLKNLPDEERKAFIAAWRQRSSSQIAEKEQMQPHELRMLASAGISVGNHTLTHPCLTRCTQDVIDHEIVEAHSILTAALGVPPRSFAYPNGDWDQRVLSTLRRCGYEVGFLFDHRMNPRSVTEPLTVSRVLVDSDTSLDRFRIIVSGLHPGVSDLRRRARV